MKNGIGSLALLALAACGSDVDSTVAPEGTSVLAQQDLEEILRDLSEVCSQAATDVNEIVCPLSSEGARVGTITMGCWTNPGEWQQEGAELSSYDRAVWANVCVAQ